jgi:uncharacterized protein (TIGR03435 family)
MRNRLVGAALILAGLPAVAAGRQAAPRFDVVSIKPNTSGSPASSLRPEPGGLSGTNVTAMRLFRVAYQVATFQVVDAPAWFDSDRFDVAAKSAAPVPPAELGRMVRGLLAERFGLRVETGRRDLSGFELRVERAPHPGLKAAERPCRLADPNQPLPPASAERPPPCFSAIAGELSAHGVTMEMVAQQLTAVLQQPVADRTALSGVFDFELRWSPDATAASSSDAPPLVTAVREQLGLRLMPARVPVDAYVITAARRPDAN